MRKVERGQKEVRGGWEKQKKFLLSPLLLFCPCPTFRTLSHLLRLDSQRSPGGKEETTHSLPQSTYVSMLILSALSQGSFRGSFFIRSFSFAEGYYCVLAWF